MAEHEYEAKFLAIDVEAVRDRLRAGGAERVFPKTRFTRLIFENDAVQGEQWLRLRDEGGQDDAHAEAGERRLPHRGHDGGGDRGQ